MSAPPEHAGRATCPTGPLAVASSHDVVFSESDDELVATVVPFLEPSLRGGDPTVVVATRAHLAQFDAALRAAGVDVDAAMAAGDYVALDAEETLASLMVEGAVDPERVDELFSTLLTALRDGRPGCRPRVFGEMVGLLWDRGDVTACLELEAQWNRLVARHGVALRCAYPTAGVVGTESVRAVSQVCAAHPDGVVDGARGHHDDVAPGATPAVDRLWLNEQLLDEVDAAVVATALDGTVTVWNTGAERLYGWPARDALGRSLLDLVVPAFERDRVRWIFDRVLADGAWQGRHEIARRDGSIQPVYLRAGVIRDAHGAGVGTVGVTVDVSDQLALQQRLARSHQELLAVVDHVGDGLCALDERGRITDANPQMHVLIGGTDANLFGAALADRLAGTDPLTMAGTASHSMVAPVEDVLLRVDGSTLPIEYTATAVRDPHHETVTEWVVVIRDITERREQEARQLRDREQAAWGRRIRAALRHDGFTLHAQPIIELGSGRATHHELLVRLVDPAEGVIAPGRFMPTAEAIGLAPAIDRWVIARGLETAAAGVAIHLNLSAMSLQDGSLIGHIRRCLQTSGADPRQVVFEVTETCLLENDDAARRFAEQVRELGCKVALDDFGTGYSSFVYLKKLPVDVLKIDREFVHDAEHNPSSRHVIAAVVALAQAFGGETVAEGVEDDAVLPVLTGLGVDSAQGFALGRPRPVADVLAELARHRPA